MTRKQQWTWGAIIGSCLLLLFLVEWAGSSRDDFSERRTYERDDKNPFGSYALFQLLEGHVGAAPAVNRAPLVEASFWNDYRYYDYDKEQYVLDEFDKTLMFVQEYASFDQYETDLLMQAVRRGGTVFLAASDFSGPLIDSLAVSTAFAGGLRQARDLIEADTFALQFVAPNLRGKGPYRYKDDGNQLVFRPDTVDERARALARNSFGEPVFLRVDRGAGSFYLHTEPTLFTNCNVIADSVVGYLERAVSYLPASQDVIWDEYYKPYNARDSSKLSVILRQPSLAWAARLAFGLLLLFVCFNVKRKQRPIPEVAPPANDTLEFVETIGRLYYQRADHDNLARKKIRHFKDFLREHYAVRAEELADERTVQRVAHKANAPVDEVRALVKLCGSLSRRNEGSIGEQELAMLNARIEDFHRYAV